MDDFLERRRVPIIILLLIIIAAGLVVIYVRWPRTPAGLGALRSPGSDAPLIITIQRDVTVHVAGAVQRPGVYTLRDGLRVADAIDAAGGATADADLTHLNLAQKLRDEGYILVPDKNAPASSSASTAPGALLNINTASLAQLDALPGIGATYAKRIVDYRSENGPFQKTSDLVTLKLTPQSTFDKVKDLIDVK